MTKFNLLSRAGFNVVSGAEAYKENVQKLEQMFSEMGERILSENPSEEWWSRLSYGFNQSQPEMMSFTAIFINSEDDTEVHYNIYFCGEMQNVFYGTESIGSLSEGFTTTPIKITID